VTFNGGAGGAGGAGVDLSSGTVANHGSITGGNGGIGGDANSPPYSGGAGGQGGAGVYLNGGTLVTSGTISGGAGASGGYGYPSGFSGAYGDAVQFGSVASTLEVEAGAVFNGPVVANASVADTLRLLGTQSGGTPITLGEQFSGFSSLSFASGAAWTVDVDAGAAPSAGLAINDFTTSDTVDVTNLTPAQAQADFNSSTHTLTSSTDGALHFASGPFSGESFLFSNDGSGGTDMSVVVGSAISSVLTSTVSLGSGAYKSPLTISNAGGVTPSSAAAVGVVSDVSGNVLTNYGVVDGGAGSSGSAGGAGGIGLSFKLGSTATNAGSIAGGNGGTGSAGAGGAGAVGADLLAGTLTNTGNITGGLGGAGSTTGGVGGAAVLLNGGTLIEAGTVSGGTGGSGASSGAAGDAVAFGSTVSTLIIDPGAVFNGHVVGNSSVKDVLEVASTQAGGTAVTLGTQFLDFSTLDFASGAGWTVDATKADLLAYPLTIDGFALGDTLDTTIPSAGATASFKTSSEVLTITQGGTKVTLQFNSAFSGEHFVLKSDGHSGTDVQLQSGAAQTLAAAASDPENFVSAEHRALLGAERALLGAGAFDSSRILHVEPALAALNAHGFASNGFVDHGALQAHIMLR
jgi:hypothetical protein